MAYTHKYVLCLLWPIVSNFQSFWWSVLLFVKRKRNHQYIAKVKLTCAITPARSAQIPVKFILCCTPVFTIWIIISGCAADVVFTKIFEREFATFSICSLYKTLRFPHCVKRRQVRSVKLTPLRIPSWDLGQLDRWDLKEAYIYSSPNW